MAFTAANFLREFDLIGCYTDDHDTEYGGDTYTTPSLINHDDGKETRHDQDPLPRL